MIYDIDVFSNSLHVIAVYKTICNFVCTKFGWAEGGTEGFVRPNRYFINVAGQLQKAATSPLSCLGKSMQDMLLWFEWQLW